MYLRLYLNSVTTTFQAFETTSARYETERGSTIGTSAQDATRREGVTTEDGCRSDVGPVGT